MIPMSAAEAVYGFAAWITTREQLAIAGAPVDSAPWADLVKRFCDANGLGSVGPAWPDNLTIPPEVPDGD